MDATTASSLVELRLRQRHASRAPGRPITLGIAGGSAAGKSTLSRALAEQLAPCHVEIVGQDRFFKPRDELPRWTRTQRSEPWPDYNQPDSIRIEALVEHVASLAACDIAIVEGILVLHPPELRQWFDLCCYVTAAADERIVRRIRRNVAAGLSLDDVADYYLDSVRFQHERYNAPTSTHADLLVPGGVADQRERDALTAAICAGIQAYRTSRV
jgi:uridine kinase